MTVDELQDELARFRSELRAEFSKVRAEMKDGLRHGNDEFVRIVAEIRADGETTRRHFDAVVETIRDSARITADGTAHHTVRLNNHEARLKRLEKPRRG